MQQPELRKVNPLDKRTVDILKGLSIELTEFDPEVWRKNEEQKAQEKYNDELQFYIQLQNIKKNELIDLAFKYKENMTEKYRSGEEKVFELFLKSIDLYFEQHDGECFFGDYCLEEIEDGFEWGTEWKSHDYGEEYLSYEERMEESSLSTNLYLNLDSLFDENEDSATELLLQISEIWCEIGYQVFLARFSWSRNYSVEFHELSKTIYDDYMEGRKDNLFEDCDWYRFYLKRK